MRIEVPYGRTRVCVEVPDTNLAGVFGPRTVPAVDEAAELTRALARPCGGAVLDDLLPAGVPVLIIVNDHTRTTPTAKVLKHLGPVLERADPTFLVACGIHRAPTEPELRRILGAGYDRYRGRTRVHSARDGSSCVPVGTTSRGTRVLVNELVARAERILVIGSVEPHYFAGFTGGRKAIVPGVAAYATIERNHALAMTPGAQALVLDGNPVHEDMVEAVALLSDTRMLGIMTVLDPVGRIHFAAAGDLDGSFREAARVSAGVHSVEVPGKADVVVAVASAPLDIDLYQSQKAIEHAKLALRDGGVLVLVSECREGIGDPAFVEILRGRGSSPAPERATDAVAFLGQHKAANLASLMSRADLWAVTSLPPDVPRSIGLRPLASLQAALDAALAARPEARVLFLMAASTTVPRLP